MGEAEWAKQDYYFRVYKRRYQPCSVRCEAHIPMCKTHRMHGTGIPLLLLLLCLFYLPICPCVIISKRRERGNPTGNPIPPSVHRD